MTRKLLASKGACALAACMMIAAGAAGQSGSAKSQTNSTAAPTSGASCADITKDGPELAKLKEKKLTPADFCPIIEALAATFKKAESGNHFPRLNYTQPSEEFFAALAGSMKYYRRSKTQILVSVGGASPVTLESLDTGEDANKFKRNLLGLILERIRNGDKKNKRAGKLCVKYEEKSPSALIDWAGTAVLKYMLPALVKLFGRDPVRDIDSYDALVLLQRVNDDDRTNPIRSVTFVPRGALAAGCKQIKADWAK